MGSGVSLDFFWSGFLWGVLVWFGRDPLSDLGRTFGTNIPQSGRCDGGAEQWRLISHVDGKKKEVKVGAQQVDARVCVSVRRRGRGGSPLSWSGVGAIGGPDPEKCS